LLNRTTRRLSLTETGREFYERSMQIVSDVEEAEQVAGQMNRTPQGC
jgi:DNA-binding transcriptional LysR family regulator